MQVLFFIFSKFFPSPARESSPGISRGCSLPVTQERAQAMVRVLAAAAAVVAAAAIKAVVAAAEEEENENDNPPVIVVHR